MGFCGADKMWSAVGNMGLDLIQPITFGALTTQPGSLGFVVLAMLRSQDLAGSFEGIRGASKNIMEGHPYM